MVSDQPPSARGGGVVRLSRSTTREDQRGGSSCRLEHFPDVEAYVSGDPVGLPFADRALLTWCSPAAWLEPRPGSPRIRSASSTACSAHAGRLLIYKLPNRLSYLEEDRPARAGMYYHGAYPHDRVYDRRSAIDLVSSHGLSRGQLQAHQRPAPDRRAFARLAPERADLESEPRPGTHARPFPRGDQPRGWTRPRSSPNRRRPARGAPIAPRVFRGPRAPHVNRGRTLQGRGRAGRPASAGVRRASCCRTRNHRRFVARIEQQRGVAGHLRQRGGNSSRRPARPAPPIRLEHG